MIHILVYLKNIPFAKNISVVVFKGQKEDT